MTDVAWLFLTTVLLRSPEANNTCVLLLSFLVLSPFKQRHIYRVTLPPCCSLGVQSKERSSPALLFPTGQPCSHVTVQMRSHPETQVHTLVEHRQCGIKLSSYILPQVSAKIRILSHRPHWFLLVAIVSPVSNMQDIAKDFMF